MDTKALRNEFDRLYFRKTVLLFLLSLAVFCFLLRIIPGNPDTISTLYLFVVRTGIWVSGIATVFFAVYSVYFLSLRRMINRSFLHFRLGIYENALYHIRHFPKRFYFPGFCKYVEFLDKKVKEPRTAIFVEKTPQQAGRSAGQLGIDAEIYALESRQHKFKSLRDEIRQKADNVKKYLVAVKDQSLRRKFSNTLEQYNEMLDFIDFRIEIYGDIRFRLILVKNKILFFDRLEDDKDILERYTRKLLEQGYSAQYFEDYGVDFYKTQEYYAGAVKEFLLSDIDVDNRQDFERLTNRLYKKLSGLNTLNDFLTGFCPLKTL